MGKNNYNINHNVARAKLCGNEEEEESIRTVQIRSIKGQSS